MTQAEVVKLFKAITLAYPAFRLPDDKDKEQMAKEQVLQWYEHLKDVPFDVAMENFRRHVRTEKYPPTIADLRRPLSKQDPETVYHEQLRREREEYFARLDEFARTAVPAPPEVKERMRQLAAQRAYGG